MTNRVFPFQQKIIENVYVVVLVKKFTLYVQLSTNFIMLFHQCLSGLNKFRLRYQIDTM